MIINFSTQMFFKLDKSYVDEFETDKSYADKF